MTLGDYYNVSIRLMRFSLIAEYAYKDEWLQSFFETELDLFWEDHVWLSSTTRSQARVHS